MRSPRNGLRIAVTADPDIPVPPDQYGGIERIVDLLVRGLVARGHKVTLFAHPSSTGAGELRPYPATSSRSALAVIRNSWHVSGAVVRGHYDLVHSFGRLAYLVALLPLPIPKLMSYQRVITPRSVVWSEHLAPDSLHFAACSRHLMRHHDGKRNWHVVYNGVPRRAYEPCFAARPDAPLVFLGRIEEIKGTHIAIDVARRAGRDLIIAGNVSDEWRHQHYFETRVAPYLDGVRIRYVGPVNDRQKAQLLGGAAALLMPVLWDEPFGIVMAEALACGTPVIGFGRGSVPEVVVHGLTGFVCQSVEDMVDAVQRIRTLDRAACRQDMEERFSDRSVVSGYLRVYESMLERTGTLRP